MRKNFLKKVMSAIMISSTCMLVMFPHQVTASEKFEVNSDIKKQIEDAVYEHDVDPNYFKQIVNMFENNIHTNSEDLNDLLQGAIDNSVHVNETANNKLLVAQKQMENLDSKENKSIVQLAKDAYHAGIAKVIEKGCPQTANYMMHAEQGNGKTYQSNNDAWAKKCALNSALFAKIQPQFENEILATGKTYGTVSGSFEFTKQNSSLDHFASLHLVNYSVTFTKTSAGYSAVYNITDVYDFDWMNYEDFAIGFGNNYCVAMQNLGLIKPFKISIVYNM